ncbi:MAG: ABC transporter permease [Ardenticatenaceae bacterium]|nr:ABC transporter permease [Ardenticatenaceae bacterium]
MRLLLSFFLRDYHIQTSYRLSFFLSFFGIFFRAFTFFFISRLVGDSASPYLEGFDGDYFAFVLIGIAFNNYFGTGLSSFSTALRQSQTTGTLEAVLMTPTPVSTMIVGSAGWNYFFTTVQVLTYFVLGLFLGLDLSAANWPLAAFSLLLSILVFASIGILSAGVIMIIKRGNPITALLSSLFALLGGIYYPISLLPDWLQFIANLLPITYALNVMRLALINGASWFEARWDLSILALFCLLLFPFSLWFFGQAVDYARREGTLAHY